MSDINLLPEELRRQDEQEQRRNRREPHRHDIELTTPLAEEKPLPVPKPPQKHPHTSWRHRLLFWKKAPGANTKREQPPVVDRRPPVQSPPVIIKNQTLPINSTTKKGFWSRLHIRWPSFRRTTTHRSSVPPSPIKQGFMPISHARDQAPEPIINIPLPPKQVLNQPALPPRKTVLDLSGANGSTPSSTQPVTKSVSNGNATQIGKPISWWHRFFSRRTPTLPKTTASVVVNQTKIVRTPHLSLLPDDAIAASQMPSEESWSVFLAFAIVACFLVGLVYWGLTSIELNNITTLDVLKPKVTTLSEYKKILEPDKVKAIALNRRIRTIQQLLDNHIYTSNVMQLLERLTLPEVQYRSLKFDTSKLSATLEAQTNSFGHVGEQLHVFESASDSVKSVTITGGESAKDATNQASAFVTFSINLQFFPSVLQVLDPRKEHPTNTQPVTH